LLKVLACEKIHAAGTVRANRKGQTPFISGKEIKKLPRGASEEIVKKDQDVVMVRWQILFSIKFYWNWRNRLC
jgi:hypothetical protein